MSTLSPKGLLRQARHLATKERVRPQQASLRRAVSTAYYALFHLLVTAASKALGRGDTDALPRLLARAFVHEDMEKACRTFASAGPMPSVIAALYPAVVVPLELKRVAETFVHLQEERHAADYGTHKVWTRVEALTDVERAEQAFVDWEVVRPRMRPNAAQAAMRPVARLFLAWLVFQKKLQGR
jgi:uncharacterized protein (UPF0332 family)